MSLSMSSLSSGILGRLYTDGVPNGGLEVEAEVAVPAWLLLAV